MEFFYWQSQTSEAKEREKIARLWLQTGIVTSSEIMTLSVKYQSVNTGFIILTASPSAHPAIACVVLGDRWRAESRWSPGRRRLWLHHPAVTWRKVQADAGRGNSLHHHLKASRPAKKKTGGGGTRRLVQYVENKEPLWFDSWMLHFSSIVIACLDWFAYVWIEFYRLHFRKRYPSNDHFLRITAI